MPKALLENHQLWILFLLGRQNHNYERDMTIAAHKLLCGNLQLDPQLDAYFARYKSLSGPNNRIEGTMLLREATDEDAPTLFSVMQAAFEQYRGQLDPPSGVHKETIETILSKLKEGSAAIVLVDNKVAGCVFYHAEGSHLELSRLSVLPAYRRQGLGRELISYVEMKAQELNLRRVRLGVRLALLGLRAYYEGQGYLAVEYKAHEGYPEPTYVIMEKEVS